MLKRDVKIRRRQKVGGNGTGNDFIQFDPQSLKERQAIMPKEDRNTFLHHCNFILMNVGV